MTNIFTYGFRERTAFIDHHPHFYPPGQLEDRVDQVLIPVLEGLAQAYGRKSAVPDLVSVTPGFWGMLRQSAEDDRNKAEGIKAGMSQAEADRKWESWRTMPPATRTWHEQRMSEVIRHLGSLWAEAPIRPRIVWRALHRVWPKHEIPLPRVVAIDQIGRAVVEGLVMEGLAAEGGEKTWRAWVKRQAKKVGVPEKWVAGKKGEAELTAEEKEREAKAMGLQRRLKIDEWGPKQMDGQVRTPLRVTTTEHDPITH